MATREEFERASRRYVATHWGRRGPVASRDLMVPDPFAQMPTELGELIAVVYRTEKGLEGRGDYEHTFRRTRPRLCFNDGGLIIAGGSYHVSWKGIVG